MHKCEVVRWKQLFGHSDLALEAGWAISDVRQLPKRPLSVKIIVSGMLSRNFPRTKGLPNNNSVHLEANAQNQIVQLSVMSTSLCT